MSIRVDDFTLRQLPNHSSLGHLFVICSISYQHYRKLNKPLKLFTIDDNDLCNLGVGNFWDSHFVGALGYAD